LKDRLVDAIVVHEQWSVELTWSATVGSEFGSGGRPETHDGSVEVYEMGVLWSGAFRRVEFGWVERGGMYMFIVCLEDPVVVSRVEQNNATV
jgi:hypothetical protein